MKVNELITELQTFPADAEVDIYAGKCCDVQPIHRVHFQPSDDKSAGHYNFRYSAIRAMKTSVHN